MSRYEYESAYLAEPKNYYVLALGASREDGNICSCCLCFRKIFTDVAYVLERFSLILAYVLEIICNFALKF